MDHAKTALCALLCALPLVLAACAPATKDETPIYTETLPNTGVTLTLANCTLDSTDEVPYVPTRETGEEWVYYPALHTSQGQPLLTFTGATDDQIDIVYVEDIGELYVAYDRMDLQILVDYLRTDLPDGVQYRMDTVYNYRFDVTTEQGTDTFFLIESREGLE